MLFIKNFKSRLTTSHIFMLSVLIVNAGNYLYNLLLARFVGPRAFSDAAILVTLVLVLSFIAMTFQLVTAKFYSLLEQSSYHYFFKKMFKFSVVFGIVLGIAMVLNSEYLQHFFNTTSAIMFVIFGCSIPFYFMMSMNRGIYQGKKDFVYLSVTYQLEMLSRLFITFLILIFFDFKSSNAIALGIAISFVFGLFPFKWNLIKLKVSGYLSLSQQRMIFKFFGVTAFYELTQIIINNSDIVLVKHYFDAYEAGLYASLALIGRVVYFVSWSFFMLLLPTVSHLKQEGKPTTPVLLKYMSYTVILSVLIILSCALFPEFIVSVFFGGDYLGVSDLLWMYALVSGVFAIANVFAYYFLSLEVYLPVVLSAVFGLLQVILIVRNHQDLKMVVEVQLIAVLLLLAVQGFYFLWHHKKHLKFQDNPS